MSWSARIHHTDGGLAITFAEPLTRLTMTPDVAAHFARLLAAEASATGVATTLEAENGSRAAVQRPSGGDRQTDATDSLLPENMPIRVIGAHPLCCDCDGCLNGDRHV